MAKKNNSDADSTMYFRSPSSKKSTDKYDTGPINTAETRRRANNPKKNTRTSSATTPSQNETDIYSGDAINLQNNNATTPPPNTYRGAHYTTGRGAQRAQTGQGTQTGQPRSNNAARQQNSRDNANRQNNARQSAPPRSNNKRPKKKRNGSLVGRIIRIIVTVVVVIFVLYSGFALIGIASMDHVDTGTRLYTDGALDESYVKNILVIGTDSRDPEKDAGRSDSMILVSINSHTNKIYMTSLLRDAYVEIPNNGTGKLNAAYSYGGADLLLDTIEYNYGISIDDYVLFTFEACADMIDAVGGVEITLSDREAEAVNEILISEVNELAGDDRNDDLLDGGGTLLLDGKQALSYSRIRYVGNADFERTERQRTVMQQVMEKAIRNPFRLLSICVKALPDMVTNMSIGKLYLYALQVPYDLVFYDLEQQRLPEDDMFTNDTIGGEAVLRVNFDAITKELKSTVYAD